MRGGIRRVLEFWRAEQRTIRQGFAAMLTASVASLAAGVTLGAITGTLESLPGLIALVPAAIATRGNIFGALGSRLATTVHAGLFETSRRREGVLYQNVYAATVLTFAISLLVGVLAKLLTTAFGVETISLLDFVVISILGGILASIAVGALTVALTVVGYRRGWDLDSVSAPVVTAAGDVLTVPAIFAATFAVGIDGVTEAVAGILLIATTFLFVRGLLTDLPLTRRILQESLPILLLAGTVDILAGIVLEARLEQFVEFPVLLVLIPPLLWGAGGLGGILAARLASKLHLGVVTPRGRPDAVAVLDFTLVYLFGIVIFPLLGFAGEGIAGLLGLASPGLVDVVLVSLLAGLIATSFAVIIAYYAAVATYRLGLDPDNYGIPAITSSLDFLGVVAIVVALVVVGVS